MLKWIEIIRIASSSLVSSQSDHGTISAGVTSNVEVSSDVPNSWSIDEKLGSDEPVSSFIS